MAHAEFLDQKVQELHRTQTNLSKVQSLHPIPVIRSARRLRREIAALQARETRLAHEISALEG